MQKLLLFLLLITPALLGAQAISEHGYRYTMHRKTGSTPPRRGETAKLLVDVFAGDSLLQTSRKTGGTYRYELPAANVRMEHYPPMFDAALLMGVGDSLTIWQPVDTFMRRFLPQAVQHIKEIRFELSMREVISSEIIEKENQELANYLQNLQAKIQSVTRELTLGNLDSQCKKGEGGLKVLVERDGTGNPLRRGEPLSVHYIGMLTDGTAFDNSFERKEPLAFPVGVGQMITGFDEGLMLLRHGARAYIYIPYDQAYGENGQGPVPPQADLVFYVEVL